MSGQNARTSSLLLLLIVGCAPLGTWLGKEPTDGSESFSKVKLGMGVWDVEAMFGHKKGKEFAPEGWPRTLGEVPGYEDSAFATEEIRWFYWRVRDAHKWIAIGSCRTNNHGGSLTMDEIVIKKSGFSGPDLPPGASPAR